MTTIRHLTIGAVTRLANVSPSTLRGWELQKLIPEPARSGDGRRQYAPEDVALIRDLARQRRRGRKPASRGGIEAPASPNLAGEVE
jgi:DNA-binding transcriptional MerR regulator